MFREALRGPAGITPIPELADSEGFEPDCLRRLRRVSQNSDGTLNVTVLKWTSFGRFFLGRGVTAQDGTCAGSALVEEPMGRVVPGGLGLGGLFQAGIAAVSCSPVQVARVHP